MFDFSVAVAAEARRLQRVVIVGVDGRQGNQFGDPGEPAPSDHIRQAIAQRAGIQEDRGGARQCVCDRGDHLDIGGQPRGVRRAGDSAHGCACGDESGDERAADVAGRSGDDNGHDYSFLGPWGKSVRAQQRNGVEDGKVTVAGRNFSEREIVEVT